MAPALQCPDCGHQEMLEHLGGVATFRCGGCGRALKVPAQFRDRPAHVGEPEPAPPQPATPRPERVAPLSDQTQPLPRIDGGPPPVPRPAPAPKPEPVSAVGRAAERSAGAVRAAGGAPLGAAATGAAAAGFPGGAHLAAGTAAAGVAGSAASTAAGSAAGTAAGARRVAGGLAALGSRRPTKPPDETARAPGSDSEPAVPTEVPRPPLILRLVLWVVALPLGALIVFAAASALGMLDKSQLEDTILRSDWGRFLPVARLLPFCALATALIVQLGVFGLEQWRRHNLAATRAARASARPRRPRPEGRGPSPRPTRDAARPQNGNGQAQRGARPARPRGRETS